MSRKLATIIKDSRIPGKWKRVLEAYAATANNDGTNIYKSKTKLGDLAGASPDTIYRQTPDLLACGILTIAKTHMCKVENCNKGATHFTGKWGHYTTAYDLHIDQLQNAETYLSAKHQKVRAAKCRKVGDANCGTTLTIEQTQAPSAAPKQDSSALTSGKSVSQLVSQCTDSLRSPQVEDQEKNNTSSGLGDGAEQDQKQKPDAATVEVMTEVGMSDKVPKLLGLYYFSSDHDKELQIIAEALINRNRSLFWLEDLVAWAKQHQFWKKRLHNGNRAVTQLAKFLAAGDVSEQFDGHLVANKFDVFDATNINNAYVQKHLVLPTTPIPEGSKVEQLYAEGKCIGVAVTVPTTEQIMAKNKAGAKQQRSEV